MVDKDDTERSPNPIDIHVGSRVRARRKVLDISQERLADHLGLTFQQVQKYERGANRVSASKLYEIARALDAPIAFFFEGLPDPTSAGAGQPGMAEAGGEFTYDLAMTPEARELAGLFGKIRRKRVRAKLLELTRALVDEEARDEG